mgnify:CR=1 FL=1
MLIELSLGMNSLSYLPESISNLKSLKTLSINRNGTKKLPDNRIMLNYFAEYHGKCICDSHFSLLSRYYRDYSMSSEFKHAIYTTDEFIKLLQTAVLNSNKSTALLNSKKERQTKLRPLLQVKFLKYERSDDPVETINQIKASNFTSFYHFAISKNANPPVLLAKLHEKDQNTHKYELKTTETENRNKTQTKKGYQDTQKKPFITREKWNLTWHIKEIK